MKRVISIIICIVLALSFVGCASDQDKESLKNVSLLRKYYLVGNSDNYFVEMYGGKRESPLIVDGSSGKLKDYVKIKVLVKNSAEGDYTYHIGINEEEYAGTLTKEVAGGCLVANISATDLESEYLLKITFNNKTEEIKLTSKITPTMISYAEAREIAEKELKEVKSNFGDEYEVYIKFVEGEKGTFKYYWYVAFINGEKICACLIDPESKKIIAKRS